MLAMVSVVSICQNYHNLIWLHSLWCTFHPCEHFFNVRDTLLNILCSLTWLILTRACAIASKMGKPRPREVEQPAKSHRAGKTQTQSLTQAVLLTALTLNCSVTTFFLHFHRHKIMCQKGFEHTYSITQLLFLLA